MICRRWMLRLFSGAVILPIGLAVLFLVRQLLAALGDNEGAWWLERIGIFLLVVWGVNLIALLLGVAARQLFPPEDE